MAGRRKWTPAELRQGQRILRDFTILFLGAFILLWQTLFVATPNPLLIGAGLVLLGLPPAFRLDARNGEDH